MVISVVVVVVFVALDSISERWIKFVMTLQLLLVCGIQFLFHFLVTGVHWLFYFVVYYQESVCVVFAQTINVNSLRLSRVFVSCFALFLIAMCAAGV